VAPVPPEPAPAPVALRTPELARPLPGEPEAIPAPPKGLAGASVETPARAPLVLWTGAMPRMPVVTEKGLELVPPGVLEPPVGPDVAEGLATAEAWALPVLPVFVELDWELASPLRPDWATGETETLAAPPLPPDACPTATLDPPVLVPEPPMRRLVAPPPPAAAGTARPPGPPLPPTAKPLTEFDALPVAPDCDEADELDPELAWLVALAVAVAVPGPAD
jgi:hypothetical protein